MPVAQQLNAGYKEYTTKTKVSHLLYIDDLKLIGKTKGRTPKTNASS